MRDDIPLRDSVGKGGINDRLDVAVVQAILTLGRNRQFLPYYDARVDGDYGSKTEAAIKSFQDDQGSDTDPIIYPDSPAVRPLSEIAESEFRTQSAAPPPYLTFDGKALCWVGEPYNGTCWAGVSGKRGFQLPKHQSLKDKGPIPEGVWRVRQDEYQSIDDVPWLNRFFGMLSPLSEKVYRKLGRFPGDLPAWGEARIWLKPVAVPNIYGRDIDTFSIHGGWVAASAGCIDLTHSIAEFAEAFTVFGADLDLIVAYEKEATIETDR